MKSYISSLFPLYMMKVQLFTGIRFCRLVFPNWGVKKLYIGDSERYLNSSSNRCWRESSGELEPSRVGADEGRNQDKNSPNEHKTSQVVVVLSQNVDVWTELRHDYTLFATLN